MQTETIEGYRLSYRQRQLWLSSQESRNYRVQAAVEIGGALDGERLKRAVEEVVRRHDILRTTFRRLQGMDVPLQVISDEPAFFWRAAERGVDGAAEAELIADTLREEGAAPFDYAEGPLARFRLLELAPERHIFFVTVAALCADTATLDELIAEVARAYEAGRDGASEEKLQYVQFSEWQHQLLAEESAAEGVAFWQQQNSGLAEVTLPDESRAPSATTGTVEYVAIGLSQGAAARVGELDASRGASFLLACWQTLLWRLTGEPAFAVNVRFGGRKYEELQGALGPFSSHLPVRAQLDGRMRFEDLLARTEKAAHEAEVWQEFFKCEPAGAPESGASAEAPLFEYEELPAPTRSGGLVFTHVARRAYDSPFRLRLSALRDADSFAIELHYDAAAVEPAAARRLAGELAALIECAAARPQSPLARLDILSEEERRAFKALNTTARDYRREVSVQQLFEEQAAKTPERDAVVYEDERLSYAELNTRANKLAHYLRRLGTGPETLVALCFERSVEMIVAVFGVLKAGGAYVPLDPKQPAPRLRALLEDAAPAVLLTQERLLPELPAHAAVAVCLDRDWPAVGGESAENPAACNLPDNLAYVIYTSGSTGTPKGVMVRHEAVVNLKSALDAAVYAGSLGPLRMSVNAPLFFDASVKQVIQLLGGHTLHVVPEHVRPDGEELLAFVRRAGLDALDCTPSQLRLLLAAAGEGEGLPLELALVGGEALDPATWGRLSAHEGVSFFNLYGPTETTVDATSCLVGGDRPSIGRPLANTQTHILDEEMSPAPVGVAGELYIGGDGLARGYLNRPALTAERFVPDPFAAEPGQRLYRTGDLTRHLPDGRIGFVGRADFQMKVRGYRVELGEIEAVLGGHPAVGEVVVTALGDRAEEQQLVAYVVPRRAFAAEGDGRARYELPNGLSVVHQNKNETDYLYEEIFEKQTYIRHGIRLREDACVFDVGANIGMFTLFVAQQRPGARIFAFEPLRPLFDTLRANTDLYSPNVKLFPFGLSDQARQETFSYYPRYSMMSGQSEYSDAASEVEVIKSFMRNEQQLGTGTGGQLLAHADELLEGRFEAETHECTLRALSDVIREQSVERIDLLKIDVQRAELDVLRGITPEDWAKIEQVVMEVHDSPGTVSQGRVKHIAALLEGQGFDVNAEQDVLLTGTDRFNLYATRRRAVQAHANGNGNGNGNGRHHTPPPPPSNFDRRALSPDRLRTYLRERLPEYMVPSQFVLLDVLPLTPNGKVDRKALPAPEAGGASGVESEGPRTPVEELLCSLFADVLRAGRVGVGDDFFALGGHSLLATQLVSRVREAFSVELPLRSLFEHPTPSSLAPLVERAMRDAAGAAPAPPVEPVSRTEDLPLSFAQQRLWFLDQLEPGSSAYNIPAAVRLTGALDAEALGRALTEVVRRHEALRTSFAAEAGRPRQVISPAEAVELPVEDLSGLGEAEREARARAEAEAEAGFDLAAGPLLRAKLLRLSDNEHVLLLTLHHIVSDGWSVGVLVKELSTLYAAFSRGKASPLAELPVQYADYAVWQRRHLSGDVLDSQLAYWRERLRGVEPLALPTDRPRAGAPGHAGASLSFSLSTELSASLRALSRREGVTLFMTLLAGFQLLLSRYAGQEDVAVGTDIAGRTRQETEGLIGFFVNQLVLRTDLSGDPSFGELLGRVREVCLGGYAHQEMPFDRLVEELAPERDLTRSPLFQVSFSMNNAAGVGGEAPDLGGLLVAPLAVENRTAKYDLTLMASEAGGAEGRLIGALQYSTALFDEATVGQILRHYTQLLESAAAEPGRRVSSLEMLAPDERETFVQWGSGSNEAAWRGRTLHGLFERQAELTPEAMAVECGEERLTYGELNARADKLAARLRAAGVGPERLAAVCMERSAEMVVALLGVLKAGGAYVPLDPSYPADRLSFMLEDSGAAVLVTEGRLLGSLPEHGGVTLCLDTDWCEAEGEQAEGGQAPTEAWAEHLAYVIYTSGSTGAPKGVSVTHGSAAVYAEGMRARLGLGTGDRVLQFAPLSFDVTVEEIFPTLAAGAAVVVPEGGGVLSAAEFTALIEGERITVCELPAAYWHEWMRDLLSIGSAVPASLRLLMLGCEKPSNEYLKVWQQYGIPLLYVFGLTETTITSSVYELPPAPAPVPADLPIGGPTPNTRLFILDRHLRTIPLGVTGELLVGGDGVARGYHGRPALTAERFVPDPFSAEPGARLYKTGDLARFLPDGQVEFLGRADSQVKVRGFRVELGEVEARLTQHPGVREAVVVAREEGGAGKRLVAYVTGAATADELRSNLRASLPEYMVPSQFVLLDALPLTPNGKVDRKALPAPEAGGASGVESEGPRTPVEELLCGLFAAVLGVGRVGVGDDFFELGGHSLLATQLVSRVREAFSVELPLRSLFERPTPEALAKEVDAARGGAAAVPITRTPRGVELPLSFAQQRLWFMDQLTSGNVAYNVRGTLRFNGALNRAALEATLTEVVRRHELLRTSFPVVEGRPVQYIAPAAPFELPLVDLSGLEEAGREAELSRHVAEEARRSFDLSQGPLIRVKLLRLGEEEHLLLYSMHHIVSDDWSMDILSREVVTLYAAFSEGRPSPLQELPVQYADYAAWQVEGMRRGALASQFEYWKQQLAGAPPVLELPTDRPRPAVQSYRGATYSFALPSPLVEGLRELSRREGVTLFMTLLAGWQTLLHRITGQKDIVTGTPIAGRNRGEVEGLIGFFVNSLALRTNFSGDPTFAQALKLVRETCLSAYANQDLPFEKIVDELAPERSQSHSPLFQVAFGLQHAPKEMLEMNGLRLQATSVPSGTAKFDMILSMVDTGNGLVGNLHYNVDLLDEGTVARWVGHLSTMLETAVASPDTRVTSLPLLNSEERRQLLVGWNDTEVAYERGLCAHELFERQVALTPEALAVECGAERLTYGELNARANKIARRLRALGVGPERLVAVSLERSAGLVASLLGVMKAGGAYVPLDPSYPLDRLSFMLEDAAAPVLVTEERLLESLPAHWGQTVCLDAEGEEIEAESGDNLTPAACPENIAYVIYTSGSTGRPKGVMVRHAGLVNMTEAQIITFGLGPSDRVFQFASPSFDASVFEIFMALRVGASLHISSSESVLIGSTLAEGLREKAATAVTLPPSVLAVTPAEDFPELRMIVAAGETCGAELVAQWGRGRRFFNAYGPTETTIWSTNAECVQDGRRPPIGQAIANATNHVLDAQLQPAPVGVTGEIYVGGAGVTRGYLNRPALTAERYIPDPFSSVPGARLYKSGDLARRLADGEIEFVGRADNQVKVRGFRVELGEIEARLTQHPSVSEAVVMAREDAGTEKRLVAYVVGSGGAAPHPAELREHLSERLPAYMMPAAFVALDAMPLTPNGKIDVRALPSPESARPSLEQAYIAPGTPLEDLLAQRWREALGVEKIGVNDNFFELGGDSIQAAILVNRLQEELGEILHVVAMFNTPTISQLAAYLEENYAAAVARLCENERPAGDGQPSAAGDTRRVDAEMVALMRDILSSKDAGASGVRRGRAKNRPTVFVLSPPRSGSTLLRVMLGGHPGLFAPPELDLLMFETLAERKACYSGPHSFWLEGTVRALMQLRDVDVSRAQELMGEYEESDMSTSEFYGVLQEMAGERMLVDKTPSYSLDAAGLRRAEECFEDARYIHLQRHPLGMIRSFLEAKIDQIYPRQSHPFSAREVAELIWLISQQNITEFLRDVPAERQHIIRFEELVAEPQREMEKVCEFLGVAYDPAMLEVYGERRARMTDGLHEAGYMLGDKKFHNHSRIDPSVGERWKQDLQYGTTEESLGALTWQTAERLGYRKEGGAAHTLATTPSRDSLASINPASERTDVDGMLRGLDEVSDDELEAMLSRVLSGEETE